jgi:succinyl-CoA synthetase beta subunit
MTEIIPILKEFYLAIVIDRKRAQRIVIASPSGGMDIEKVASEQPEQVLNLKIPDQGQLYSYQHLQLAKFLGWKGSVALEGMHLVNKLTQVFIETDALLLEINPLVETVDQKLMVLDTKLSVDDNALFRQSEIKAFFDPTQMSSSEARAHQHELAYVALNGTIGCMVNGAGLAMATMDIIHYHGGQAANFLDVGGGASKEKVAEGFKIILSDLKVKVILINIFGGIMNCETLAEGIIAAARDIQLHVPLVVRMEGTRVEEGKQRLKESNLVIEIANSLDEAARLAVAKG